MKKWSVITIFSISMIAFPISRDFANPNSQDHGPYLIVENRMLSIAGSSGPNNVNTKKAEFGVDLIIDTIIQT